VHFTIQSDHLHLIVEAPDKRGLARGVAGLEIRIARGCSAWGGASTDCSTLPTRPPPALPRDGERRPSALFAEPLSQRHRARAASGFVRLRAALVR
jgi:hypothetical protein